MFSPTRFLFRVLAHLASQAAAGDERQRGALRVSLLHVLVSRPLSLFCCAESPTGPSLMLDGWQISQTQRDVKLNRDGTWKSSKAAVVRKMAPLTFEKQGVVLGTLKGHFRTRFGEVATSYRFTGNGTQAIPGDMALCLLNIPKHSSRQGCADANVAQVLAQGRFCVNFYADR